MSTHEKPASATFTIGALSKPRHIRSTMARVMRLAAKGELATEDMTRFCRALRQLYDVVVGSELEQRIRDLEARL